MVSKEAVPEFRNSLFKFNCFEKQTPGTGLFFTK